MEGCFITEIAFQGENIILCALDMPLRTTRDYQSPEVAPALQAALDQAMHDEDNELFIDAK